MLIKAKLKQHCDSQNNELKDAKAFCGTELQAVVTRDVM